jgi:predicted Fe-Mo cluster-binding NifX family protein
MERVAIPIWQGRVSPVLDTAERLWISDLGGEPGVSPRIVQLPPAELRQRAQSIRNLGIHTLLCGAVSRPLYGLLLNAGIVVRPWLSGVVEEVLAAYAEDRLETDYFLLPGCRGRRQRGRFMRNRRGRERGRGFKNWEPL